MGLDESYEKWSKLEKRLTAPKGQYKLFSIDANEMPFEADLLLGVFNDLTNAKVVKKWQEKNNSYSEIEFIIYNDRGEVVG